MSLLLRRHHKQAEPVKEQAQEPVPKPHMKHVGGGWYELSNGDKVQGRAEAIEAEAKLN